MNTDQTPGRFDFSLVESRLVSCCVLWIYLARLVFAKRRVLRITAVFKSGAFPEQMFLRKNLLFAGFVA